MKPAKFFITTNNFSTRVMGTTGGRTAYLAKGFLLPEHPCHPGKRLAVARTIKFGKTRAKPWYFARSSWWVYDIDTGYRVPGTGALGAIACRTRDDAVAEATAGLSTTTPEEYEAHMRERQLRLATYLLEAGGGDGRATRPE